MTRDDIVFALAPYGAGLDDSTVTKDGRKLSVSLTVSKGRLRATSTSGRLVYSGPASRASVARFVESYWFWTVKP